MKLIFAEIYVYIYIHIYNTAALDLLGPWTFQHFARAALVKCWNVLWCDASVNLIYIYIYEYIYNMNYEEKHKKHYIYI